jgi:hypothetical protein
MRILKWLLPVLAIVFVIYAVSTSYRNWITTEAKPQPAMARASIRLQILNASGAPGAGRDVHEYLSRNGFDVYGDKNNDEILPRTRVVDRRDPQMSYAREVREFLTVPGRRLGPFRVANRIQPEVGCKVDSLLYVEVTVLLGADYRTFFSIRPRLF